MNIQQMLDLAPKKGIYGITISILAEVTRKGNRILTINLQTSGQDLLVLIHLTKFNRKNLRL